MKAPEAIRLAIGPNAAYGPAVVRVTYPGGGRQKREEYAAHLWRLHDTSATGVYIIIDNASGSALYVGESHTGANNRMFDTITRHFRAWKTNPRTDATGRRFGGET